MAGPSAVMEPLSTRCDTPLSVPSSNAEGSSSSVHSLSSTPPTSVAESTEMSSIPDASRQRVSSIFDLLPPSLSLTVQLKTIEEPEPEQSGRPTRQRRSMVATYNINALSGATSARRNRKSLPAAFRAAAIEEDKASANRRNISGDTLIGAPAGGIEDGQSISPEDEADSVEKQVEQELSEALNIDWSVKKLPKSRSAFSLRREEIAISTGSPVDNNRRRSTRYIKEQEPERKESLSKKLSVLGKRGRASVNEATSRMSRELKRLADTKEFSKEEDLPVIEHIWSKGKLIIPGQEPEKKKKKAEPAPELGKVKEEEQSVAVRKKEKVWLTKGLYAGQEGNVDLFAGYTAKQRKEMAKATANQPKRKILPMPLWAGQRLLHNGRDFKLPFDVCSPLPNGQPKPDEWKKSTRNRFVDDAAKLWKTPKSLDDSKCICSPEEGCGEDCLNRTMFYECDGKNCNAGKEFCKNRAFADLTERRNKGGKYRIGVEVIKTEDRGFGVRSNRCFEPHQIIVEYTGEIITEAECDRRMNEEYRNNECYYLMSFDQNMIIDATRGSIARFVNHSCEPNCKMVKWIVAGKPRMALFAGDKPIMTGEELTYDYNFDPFSSKNVQQCRCGAETCRGFLGPRVKGTKTPKSVGESVTKAVKGAVSAGKRKLKELLGAEKDEQEDVAPKKRKMATPKAKSGSQKAVEAVKSVARTLSKSVKGSGKGRSSLMLSLPVNFSPADRKSSLKHAKLSSRSSSLTIVAPAEPSNEEETPVKKTKGKGRAKSNGLSAESDDEEDPRRELTAEERDARYEAALRRLETNVSTKTVKKNKVYSVKKRTGITVSMNKTPTKKTPTKKGAACKATPKKKVTPKKTIRVVSVAKGKETV